MSSPSTQRTTAFGDLLTIVENCPPHEGFGLGLDRLTMQLLGVESIADATAFPPWLRWTNLRGL